MKSALFVVLSAISYSYSYGAATEGGPGDKGPKEGASTYIISPTQEEDAPSLGGPGDGGGKRPVR